jgi:hypothetical protein
MVGRSLCCGLHGSQSTPKVDLVETVELAGFQFQAASEQNQQHRARWSLARDSRRTRNSVGALRQSLEFTSLFQPPPPLAPTKNPHFPLSTSVSAGMRIYPSNRFLLLLTVPSPSSRGRARFLGLWHWICIIMQQKQGGSPSSLALACLSTQSYSTV